MLLGINAYNHDASVCLVDRDQVVFAAHAERYSRVKNDSELNAGIIENMLEYGTPTAVCWYELPWKRNLRQIYSGEGPRFYSIKKLLKKYDLGHLPIHEIAHHRGHAAQGFYTSGMPSASILVIDAIGENMTTSIWTADKQGLVLDWSQGYPHSMGLFYSAITQHLGLKPNEEEYIAMGMAAYGEPRYVEQMRELLFKSFSPPDFRTRKLHRGIRGLLPSSWEPYDVAASAQVIWEEYVTMAAGWIRTKYPHLPLILAGGGALNCVANDRLRHMVREVYVPANPGDAGLSLGAIAAHTAQPINQPHAYLGHDIRRRVPVEQVVDMLAAGELVGIANGRAEWGPRALGNRSILADPRGEDVQDRMNILKHRQGFRPFAPAVLDEKADSIFDVDHNNMAYMQFAVGCHDPTLYPAVCHADGTSRVQLVHRINPSILRTILEAWYERTGCPLLLNTSLNVRGEPMVNTWEDARRFSQSTGIKVY
jgi:carbamoyltransferase